MISTKEVSLIFETLLSSPGMQDDVKLLLRVPRRTALMLSKVIEAGLQIKDESLQGNILQSASEETKSELKEIAIDILKKAGLTEMNDKLQSLQSK